MSKEVELCDNCIEIKCSYCPNAEAVASRQVELRAGLRCARCGMYLEDCDCGPMTLDEIHDI